MEAAQQSQLAPVQDYSVSVEDSVSSSAASMTSRRRTLRGACRTLTTCVASFTTSFKRLLLVMLLACQLKTASCAASREANEKAALYSVVRGQHIPDAYGSTRFQFLRVPPDISSGLFCAPICYVHCEHWMFTAWDVGERGKCGDWSGGGQWAWARKLSGHKNTMREIDQPYHSKSAHHLQVWCLRRSANVALLPLPYLCCRTSVAVPP